MPSRLLARAAARVPGFLRSRTPAREVVRTAFGVPEGATYLANLRQHPFRGAFRTLFPRIPHQKKLIGLLGGGLSVRPINEMISNLLEHDYALHETLGNHGMPSEMYRKIRNYALTEGAVDAGKALARSPRQVREAVDTFRDAHPVNEQAYRIALDSLIGAPEESTPLRPGYSREDPTGMLRTPTQRIAGNAARHTARRMFPKALGASPQDVPTMTRNLVAHYRDNPEEAATLAYTLGKPLLRDSPHYGDAVSAAALLPALTPSLDYLRGPEGGQRTRQLNRMLESAAPEVANIDWNEHRPAYSAGYMPPHPRAPMGGNYAIMGSIEQTSPGITAHEIGHGISAHTPLGAVTLNPYVANLGMFTGMVTDYNRNRLTDPSPGFRRGAAWAHVGAMTPRLVEETAASAYGANRAYRTFTEEGASPFEATRLGAGAFQGLPSYYGNAFTPLIDAYRE